uniref:Uncharacterized protein n=1 Tax=Kalanchoe fedtschenkoi TaxID=63787 RepID=A0A7N0RIX6_KALFE
MERESGKKKNNSSNYINHHQNHHHHSSREGIGLGIGSTFRTRSQATDPLTSSSPDFVLQWGNKKRLRCMKIQTKDDSSGPNHHRTTARVDRRVIRTDLTHNGNFPKQRPASPPPPHRVPRNSENMRGSLQGQSSSGGGVTEHVKLLHTQEGKRGSPVSGNNHHHQHNNTIEAGGGSFEMVHEGSKKGGGGGGGSSSGSEVIPPAVWPPKFVIALTNKEKEEDFMAIKGSKLPQRPKKRSKYVQRNLKLVSPGAWLCELTLERYEVREKKTSKKRPRGLKAMCSSIESESE